MSRISGSPTISMEQAYGLTLRVARWRVGAGDTPMLFLNGIQQDFLIFSVTAGMQIRNQNNSDRICNFFSIKCIITDKQSLVESDNDKNQQ